MLDVSTSSYAILPTKTSHFLSWPGFFVHFLCPGLTCTIAFPLPRELISPPWVKIPVFARSSPIDPWYHLETAKVSTKPMPVLLRRAEDTREGLQNIYPNIQPLASEGFIQGRAELAEPLPYGWKCFAPKRLPSSTRHFLSIFILYYLFCFIPSRFSRFYSWSSVILATSCSRSLIFATLSAVHNLRDLLLWGPIKVSAPVEISFTVVKILVVWLCLHGCYIFLLYLCYLVFSPPSLFVFLSSF
jgi:hypothetical protein